MGEAVAATAALIGYRQQRNAEKNARGAAFAHSQDVANENRRIAGERSAAQAEAKRLGDAQTATQNRINQGIARGNRGRIRGGLFGDSADSPSILTGRLGNP